jgi:hypothetical protein
MVLSLLPFVIRGLRVAGHIGLKREDASGFKQFIALGKRLLNSGASLAVFPEGTRSLDGKLGQFKKGAFTIATTAKAKVLYPCSLLCSAADNCAGKACTGTPENHATCEDQHMVLSLLLTKPTNRTLVGVEHNLLKEWLAGINNIWFDSHRPMDRSAAPGCHVLVPVLPHSVFCNSFCCCIQQIVC